MRRSIALAFALLACAAGSARALPPRSSYAELDRLAKWMAGSFSNAAQAGRDTSFADVRLRIVPIWPERTEARWFYVEQALAGREGRPYRQRVYRLMPNEQGVFESAVFTIPAPLRFAGGWRMAEPLAGLTPDSLAERRGCAVYLRREKDGVYRGGTIGDGCASELDGATHATSEVVIERGRMRTLDRGFDAENRQVWGSKSGPYVFDRLPEPRRR